MTTFLLNKDDSFPHCLESLLFILYNQFVCKKKKKKEREEIHLFRFFSVESSLVFRTWVSCLSWIEMKRRYCYHAARWKVNTFVLPSPQDPTPFHGVRRVGDEVALPRPPTKTQHTPAPSHSATGSRTRCLARVVHLSTKSWSCTQSASTTLQGHASGTA